MKLKTKSLIIFVIALFIMLIGATISEKQVPDGYTVKATFETDHFSTYVLVEISNTNELDNTPKTGTTDIIKYIVPITIVSAIGVVALRKEKETK